jgi:hypothetical protein
LHDRQTGTWATLQGDRISDLRLAAYAAHTMAGVYRVK